MKAIKRTLAMVLCCSVFVYASGNTFKVRYNGGSIESKVDPKDWGNTLTVTATEITLDLKDKNKVDIPPKTVTSLSYGQEAHRRVGTMIALAVLVAPVALFGLFHKTRLHYIGIQYKTPDGKDAGILLQGDKDSYRAILVALQGVTGASVSVAEKEREFVPVGVKTTVTKGEETKVAETQTPAPSVTASVAPASVNLTTNPDGADIYVDNQFYGNSPAVLKLKPGKHAIQVKTAGYKEWSREISTDSGADLHLTAMLEKAN